MSQGSFSDNNPAINPSSSEQSHIQLQFDQPEDSLQSFSILLITWNLMGTLPSTSSITQLLSKQTLKDTDLIIIGTQQCQRTLFASFFCQSKDKWESNLQSIINLEGFIKVESNVLQGLHLIIFARSGKYLYLKDTKKNVVKTGFCNVIGNKGGISIELEVNGTRLTFVNVHLAANQDEIEHRNISLLQIIQRLLPNQKKSGLGFIFGDMNYRINISAEEAKKFIKKQIDYILYLPKDQMANQGNQLDSFRQRFIEGDISFPPTYKMKLDKNQYVSNRIPGWTDRIFYNKSQKLKLISYNSGTQIFGSDHRPVIAKFELTIQKPNQNIGEIEVKYPSRCLLF